MKQQNAVFSCLLAILFLVMVMPSQAIAQPKSYQINDFKIEGNSSVDSSLILVNLGVVRGAYLTAEFILKAIRNLWARNLFSVVKIMATNQTGGKRDMLIKVVEWPRLDSWTVEGNDKLSKKDIDREADMFRGMVFTPFVKYKARRNLLKKYQDEGYLLADVEFDIENADTTMSRNVVKANLKMNEGKKVQVKRIQVLGAETLKPKDLKGSFKEIKENRWWRGADFNEKKYEDDKENLLRYCRTQGFRDAEVIKDSLYYSEDKRDLFIDVTIEEGTRYHFGNVTFEGNTVFKEDILESQLLFTKGDIYNQEDFEISIREIIQNLYYNQGYLFANIQPLEKPTGEDTVDIDIRINEGHVVRIKEIAITGNTKTNEKVVRREFRLYPGDTFNRAMLERSVRDVWILNYFANVVPDVKLIPDDDKHVNLEVNIEERSTDTANMSAGYSERDGFIGSIGFALNNYSLKHPLTGGDGQRLSFQWDFGRFYRNLSLNFTEPWAFVTPTLVGFSIFDTRYNGNFRPWDGKEQGGSLQLGRRFRWPDNYFRGDWIFRVSENEIFNIRTSQLNNRFIFANNSTQISLTQIIRRDSRNRPEFPSFGSVYNLQTKFAGGPLQGDEDFVKNVFTMQWFVPVKYGLVMMVENKIGAIAGLNDGFYINPNELFFMGGSGLGFSESLRGYDDGTVGPRQGGRALGRFTAELRVPIAPNPTLFGLVFAEAGRVWPTFRQFNLNEMQRSVGLGARLFMPLLGIIGVDFAYGFDYFDALENRSGEWKVHFKFGQF